VRWLAAIIGIGVVIGAFIVAVRWFQPCARPITYRVGATDPRFPVSGEQFTEIADRAAAVWNVAAGKEILRREREGDVEVRTVFEKRQQAVNALREMGLQLDTDKESYEQLKARHDALGAEYEADARAYTDSAAAFEERKNEFQKAVDAAIQAGMSDTRAAALESERRAINARISQFEQRFRALERKREEVNALVSVLNRLAEEQNESVEAYREVGSSMQSEYEAGLYIRAGGRERIDIYAFSSSGQLLNLLAHEFGHAIGLPHLEDPAAIMYRSNESQRGTLSLSDRTALAELCGS
jgi:hypothetical protein